MNHLAYGNHKKNREVAGAQFLAVREVLAGLGEFGESEASIGIIRPWGEALDWPHWMYEGTSLDPSAPVPSKMTLADDFIVLSHFFDHFGPTLLLESVMTGVLADFSLESLTSYKASPGARDLLQYLVKAGNIMNPNHKFTIVEGSGGVELQVHSLVEVGEISTFIEHLGVTMIYRALSIFHPLLHIVDLSPKHVPKLMLKRASVELVERVAQISRCEVESSDHKTSIFVPQPLLLRNNRQCDPDIWKGLFARLRTQWLADASPLSISSLRLHVRQTLKESRRVPSIDEIAHDLSISSRTIGRKLASLDISFRELVLEERMQFARELLNDPSLSIAEIAYMLGYGSGAAFSRAFRNQLGTSPTDWQARSLSF